MARVTSRPHTRRQTLYLLAYADPNIDGLLDAIDAERAGPGYDLAFPDLGGIPAVLVHGGASHSAAWCADASVTTGVPMALHRPRIGRGPAAGGGQACVRGQLRYRAQADP